MDVVAADRLGWTHFGINSAGPFVALPLFGAALINSRRAPAVEVGSEQLARNRRTLLITVAILAAVLGAALVIQFAGA